MSGSSPLIVSPFENPTNLAPARQPVDLVVGQIVDQRRRPHRSQQGRMVRHTLGRRRRTVPEVQVLGRARQRDIETVRVVPDERPKSLVTRGAIE